MCSSGAAMCLVGYFVVMHMMCYLFLTLLGSVTVWLHLLVDISSVFVVQVSCVGDMLSSFVYCWNQC